jgi:hypothetical protein
MFLRWTTLYRTKLKRSDSAYAERIEFNPETLTSISEKQSPRVIGADFWRTPITIYSETAYIGKRCGGNGANIGIHCIQLIIRWQISVRIAIKSVIVSNFCRCYYLITSRNGSSRIWWAFAYRNAVCAGCSQTFTTPRRKWRINWRGFQSMQATLGDIKYLAPAGPVSPIS